MGSQKIAAVPSFPAYKQISQVLSGTKTQPSEGYENKSANDHPTKKEKKYSRKQNSSDRDFSFRKKNISSRESRQTRDCPIIANFYTKRVWAWKEISSLFSNEFPPLDSDKRRRNSPLMNRWMLFSLSMTCQILISCSVIIRGSQYDIRCFFWAPRLLRENRRCLDESGILFYWYRNL